LPRAQAVVPAPDGGYPGGNTAEGESALLHLTTGTYNTALGFLALRRNTEGQFNTGVGAGTLVFNRGDQSTQEGVQNTAIGAAALLRNTTGSFNTATGVDALLSNTTGGGNTASGDAALFNNTTGIGNTALGFGAGSGVTTASNVICIGANVTGANVSNSCFIGNIRDITTAMGDAIPVVIDSAGQLGTTSSSQRFKKEIKPMDRASEAILALKPVTFRYKSDTTATPQFGLIAEDVAAVNSDLVVHDENGEIYTVRYDAVNAMLLNEFLKEHKKGEDQARAMREQGTTIAELKSTIAQQQKGMETLAASLKEQAAQIEKVSAQIDASKPAPQVANNQ
jgi:uncharacterized coiled-coil protein SlyX